MFETIFGEERGAPPREGLSTRGKHCRRPGLEPGPITTDVGYRKQLGPLARHNKKLLWLGPRLRGDDIGKRGDNPSIPIMQRLNKSPIPRRADQDLVDTHARRHAGDEGDGAAAIFGLQHLRLFLFARHHRPQF